MTSHENKQLNRSFKLLQIESVITSLVIVMPVINIFFNELGLSQLQVGITQAVFMTIALFFDVPTGWLADRFSRRSVNMAGDFLVGMGFLLYANASNFSMVLGSEVIIAIGMSATNGADVGLLKAYTQKLKLNYTNVNARLSAIKPIAMIISAIFVGWLGAYNIRLPFYLSAVLFFIGVIISIFIKEIGERRVTEKHPLRDMVDIGRYTFKGHKKLSWRVLASVFTSNLTHTAVYILAPIFIVAGYSPTSLGIVWGIMWLSNSIGALVARRYHNRLAVIKQIAIPSIVALLAYLILAVEINRFSVWTLAIQALVFGWFASIMSPLIQQSSPADIQSTVISFSTMLRRIFYIPLVILINGLADIKLEYAMLGSAIIYGLLLLILVLGLRKTETSATIRG